MALETVVYQQPQDLFGQYNTNYDEKFDLLLYPPLIENWASSSSSSSLDYLIDTNQSSSETRDDWQYNYPIGTINDGNYWNNCNYDFNYPCSVDALEHEYLQWGANPNSPSSMEVEESGAPVEERPKRRRRVRTKKNKEEIENQRMTHIAVERNRRKQMNDYLSLLRSLMPENYVQRGDQASIIGGAINFVKELEQHLQCLSAKKQIKENASTNTTGGSACSLPFGEFFSFPQYSTAADDDQAMKGVMSRCQCGGGGEGVPADVEVTMVESHALLKIRTRRPPKQLSKLVVGLQGLRLTILHLNVSKVDGVAFYSFSVKVEEDSKVSRVDEIAKAVYEMLGGIEDEAGCFF